MSGSLTHSPQDIIRYLLIDLSLGTLPTDAGAWPVHVDHEPDLPDNCITVYGTEGTHHGRKMVDGGRIDYHGIQIRLRSEKSQTGYTKARQVAVALDEQVLRTSVTISGSVYTVQQVSRTGDVIRLGKEKPNSNRSLFTINAVVPLRQTS